MQPGHTINIIHSLLCTRATGLFACSFSFLTQASFILQALSGFTVLPSESAKSKNKKASSTFNSSCFYSVLSHLDGQQDSFRFLLALCNSNGRSLVAWSLFLYAIKRYRGWEVAQVYQSGRFVEINHQNLFITVESISCYKMAHRTFE